MLQAGTVCYRLVRFSTCWYGFSEVDMGWYRLIRLGNRYSFVRVGTCWHGISEFGTGWYGLIQVDIVWYRLVQVVTV